MLLNREFRSTVGGFLCYFPFELLKSSTNVVAFRLLLCQFILKLKRHLVVSILSFLELHPGLMDLCQDIEVLMFIHRCFIGLVDKDVVLVSDLFDFGLHHAVVVEQTVIGVFGLTDSKH